MNKYIVGISNRQQYLHNYEHASESTISAAATRCDQRAVQTELRAVHSIADITAVCYRMFLRHGA